MARVDRKIIGKMYRMPDLIFGQLILYNSHFYLEMTKINIGKFRPQ